MSLSLSMYACIVNARHAGINIFLDGFIPSENLRFRETALVFKLAETAQEEVAKRTFKREFPNMRKELGTVQYFRLQ